MQCAKTYGFEMQKQNAFEMLLECTFIIFNIWQVCLKDSYNSSFFRDALGSSFDCLFHIGQLVCVEFAT